MNINQKFGIKVRELRDAKGITQEELSYRSELHRTYISSIELGKRNVSLINIEKLAAALECSIADFFPDSKLKTGKK
jgi:transcriptional regulator with XRE-family HTH domain